jgi:hypothetical protein
MNLGMHGREIDRIATSEGCFVYSERVTGKGLTRLEMCATYHGDRDEYWVVCVGADGEETHRWNARTLHAIFWSTP